VNFAYPRTKTSSAATKNLLGILLVLAAIALIIQTSGCYHGGAHRVGEEMQALPGSPEILADYQPWFGDPDHINVGYSTLDPAVLHKQIQKAKSMGIYAFAVDWYGDRHPFEDRSYALLEQIASEDHFHVCLMYDETQEDNGQATDDALEAFDKAYRTYIGLSAPGHEAYVTYQDRPIIFIFPKRGQTNWDRVREAVNQWEHPPILIYKDNPPPQYAKDFDGYYAWIHPSHKWDPSGADWGKDYLEHFYSKMEKEPDKIIVGGVWPGFNDTKASWSLNRHMNRRCGQTFEDTLRVFHHYDDEHPMPFLLIATWNDYEEGTQIETGVSDCHSPRDPPSTSSAGGSGAGGNHAGSGQPSMNRSPGTDGRTVTYTLPGQS
jgi:Glycosyl hydrolase family 99